MAYSGSGWLALEECPRHLRRRSKDKRSVWNKFTNTAHCGWNTYRLLARGLVVVVVVSQLHGIAHAGHAHAQWRGFAFPCILASVTAQRTTAGPDTLPAIGDTRRLVTPLCGETVRQGQRRVARAQARCIAGRGRRRSRGRGGGLQVSSSVDVGMRLRRCSSSCRCRDLGVSCHGSGKAHASERARSRRARMRIQKRRRKATTAVHTLTARLLRWKTVCTRPVDSAKRHRRCMPPALPLVARVNTALRHPTTF